MVEWYFDDAPAPWYAGMPGDGTGMPAK